VLTAVLIRAMRHAVSRRRQLLMQRRRSDTRHLAEINRTTMMLLTVVTIFLIVEFPLAVLFVILIVHNTFDLELVQDLSTVPGVEWYSHDPASVLGVPSIYWMVHNPHPPMWKWFKTLPYCFIPHRPQHV